MGFERPGNDESSYAFLGEQCHLWVNWLPSLDIPQSISIYFKDESREDINALILIRFLGQKTSDMLNRDLQTLLRICACKPELARFVRMSSDIVHP